MEIDVDSMSNQSTTNFSVSSIQFAGILLARFIELLHDCIILVFYSLETEETKNRQMELDQLKAAIKEGFQALNCSEIGLAKLKQLQDKQLTLTLIMTDLLVQKEELNKLLTVLSSRKEKAEQAVEALADYQMVEKSLFPIPADKDDIEKDVRDASGKLEAIKTEIAVVKQQEDQFTERLTKGSELQSRLNRQMDAVRSSLSLKKTELRTKIASFLELKSRQDASRAQLFESALKTETSQMQKELLSQLSD